MTIVPPVPPIIPDVVQYARPGTIVPNVTPFTYRDGITYLEFLESLNTYVTKTLVPFFNTSFDALEEKWGDDMEEFVVAVNAALAAQATAINTALVTQQNNVQTALDEQQTNVDEQLADNAQAMADLTTSVNTSVTNLTNYVNTEVANLTTYVNTEVADLTTYVNSVAFQDGSVHDIVADVSSTTRLLLDSLYLGDEGAVSDAAVAALVNNPESSTRTSLDALYEDTGGSDAETAGWINTPGTATRTALDTLYVAEAELDADAAAFIDNPASATGIAVRNAVDESWSTFDWFVRDNGRRPFNSSNAAMVDGAKIQSCASPSAWDLTGNAWYYGSSFQIPNAVATVQKSTLTIPIEASQPDLEAGFSINLTHIQNLIGIYFGLSFGDTGAEGIFVTTSTLNNRDLVVRKMTGGVSSVIATIANAFAVGELLGGTPVPVSIRSENYGETFVVNTAFKGDTTVDLTGYMAGNFGSVGLYALMAANSTETGFATNFYCRVQ